MGKQALLNLNYFLSLDKILNTTPTYKAEPLNTHIHTHYLSKEVPVTQIHPYGVLILNVSKYIYFTMIAHYYTHIRVHLEFYHI